MSLTVDIHTNIIWLIKEKSKRVRNFIIKKIIFLS